MAVVLYVDGCTARSLLHGVEDTLKDKFATTDAFDLAMESDGVFVRTEYGCPDDIAIIWNKILHGILGHVRINPGCENKKTF